MTGDEFERSYAERSGISVKELRKSRIVVRCHCDYAQCDGWAMEPIACAYEDALMLMERELSMRSDEPLDSSRCEQ